MSLGVRRAWDPADIAEIERRFPPPPDYFETMYFDDPKLIAKRQLALVQQRAEQT
ncbi:MAG: hypothetical protein JRG86_00605 [Deltaproteobacteria bacterium]|jgi:hypothetical protein|nr:hypothetical protein [Deltaproteobacteria bacterium]MBW2496799.1 hypothetical protein [Deltaproteobacteria bacterium]